jgi:hypothetical protein
LFLEKDSCLKKRIHFKMIYKSFIIISQKSDIN